MRGHDSLHACTRMISRAEPQGNPRFSPSAKSMSTPQGAAQGLCKGGSEGGPSCGCLCASPWRPVRLAAGGVQDLGRGVVGAATAATAPDLLKGFCCAHPPPAKILSRASPSLRTLQLSTCARPHARAPRWMQATHWLPAHVLCTLPHAGKAAEDLYFMRARTSAPSTPLSPATHLKGATQYSHILHASCSTRAQRKRPRTCTSRARTSASSTSW